MAANIAADQLKDLEDFASGIGPGALSPQQGSLLPPAAQGGLPFGASPMPPRPPAPGPAFQQAPQALPQIPTQSSMPRPSLTLGGQPPDVMQMITERLQQIQNYKPGDAGFSQRKEYNTALQQLSALQGVANIKSQDRQLQAASLKEIKAALKEYKDLLPEQQESQRGTFEKLISAHGQLAGMQLSREDVQHTLKSADIAGMYGELLGGDYTPQERQAIFQQLGSVPANDREKVLGARRAEKDQQLLSFIQSAAPQVIAQMGYSSAKPLDMQTFLNSTQVQQVFDQNSAVKRVFNAYVNDKANAETVAAWGLKPGRVSLKNMETRQELPKMSAEMADFLGSMYKGPDGKPITATPGLITAQMMQAAKQAEMAYGIKKASEQGLSVEVYKRTLHAAPETRDQHVDINALVQTGDIVKPPPGTTVEQLNKGAYRFANPTQQKALMALKPQRTAFSDMNAMSEKLIQAATWTEAVPQGIRLYAGAVTGADPMAQAYLAATNAATSYLARMVESGVMTDQDVARWKSAATASFFDTTSSRALKIALMGDIMDTAQQAVIAQVAGVPMKQPKALSELMSKLDQSTHDTWKNTKAGLRPGEMLIKSTDGQFAKIRKGTPLTPGWTEVK